MPGKVDGRLVLEPPDTSLTWGSICVGRSTAPLPGLEIHMMLTRDMSSFSAVPITDTPRKRLGRRLSCDGPYLDLRKERPRV